ncbi:MAG: DUF2621 family protein [Acidobacteria bacterium]|nr:DUF2621 family protein [Acidobacteriota bacterium]
MHWNEAAEDLLTQILQRTPRPTRESTESQIREAAETCAADQGLTRVGVQTVIAAYIQTTPEVLRSELPRQLQALGLDESDYEHLLGDL